MCKYLHALIIIYIIRKILRVPIRLTDFIRLYFIKIHTYEQSTDQNILAAYHLRVHSILLICSFQRIEPNKMKRKYEFAASNTGKLNLFGFDEM